MRNRVGKSSLIALLTASMMGSAFVAQASDQPAAAPLQRFASKSVPRGDFDVYKASIYKLSEEWDNVSGVCPVIIPPAGTSYYPPPREALDRPQVLQNLLAKRATTPAIRRFEESAAALSSQVERFPEIVVDTTNARLLEVRHARSDAPDSSPVTEYYIVVYDVRAKETGKKVGEIVTAWNKKDETFFERYTPLLVYRDRGRAYALSYVSEVQSPSWQQKELGRYTTNHNGKSCVWAGLHNQDAAWLAMFRLNGPDEPAGDWRTVYRAPVFPPSAVR